jgi:Flp pilus assembly pilin Flp
MKKQQRAQGIAEYALILGFIVIVAMGSILVFGEQIGAWWSSITKSFTNQGNISVIPPIN